MSTQQNQENNQNLTEPDKTLQKNIDVELLNISKSIDRNLNLDYAKIIEWHDWMQKYTIIRIFVPEL